MCYSQAEGGQRCYSSAQQRLRAAIAARKQAAKEYEQALGVQERHNGLVRYQRVKEQVEQRWVEFASTPAGEDELTDAALRRPDDPDYQEWARVTVEKGVLLRERNAAVHAAFVAARDRNASRGAARWPQSAQR